MSTTGMAQQAVFVVMVHTLNLERNHTMFVKEPERLANDHYQTHVMLENPRDFDSFKSSKFMHTNPVPYVAWESTASPEV